MLTKSQEKSQQVLEVAQRLYRQNPDWVTFFREILGVDGAVRKCFPSIDALTEFEQSEECEMIQKMLVKLREQRISVDSEEEPTRVITVRLPKSMHEYLRTEAHDLRTSMNKLCISKLLQMIGEEMIPNERASGTETASPSAERDGSTSTGAAPPAMLTALNSGRPGVPSIDPLGSASSPNSAPQTPAPFKAPESRF